MDPFFPPDFDFTLNLFAGVDLIDRNGSKENMDYMDADMVMEVADTPDSLAVLQSADWSTGKAGIEGDSVTKNTHLKGSGRLRQGRVANLVSKNLDTKAFPQAPAAKFELGKTRVSYEKGKSVETIDLSQRSPLASSFPSRCRNSRRDKGKATCCENEGSDTELLEALSSFPNRPIGMSESCFGVSFDGRNAALTRGDKGNGIDLSSDPEARTEQVMSRTSQLDMSQWKSVRRPLEKNNNCSSCNKSKSRTQPELDVQDLVASVDGEMLSNLNSDMQAKIKPMQSTRWGLEASQRKAVRSRLTSNNYTSSCNIQPKVDMQTVIKPVGEEISSSFAGNSDKDDKKNTVDIYSASPSKTGQAPLRLAENNTRASRSLQNGFTSPSFVQYKTIPEDDSVKTHFELGGGTSSDQINILSPDCVGIHADKKKGKMKVKPDAYAMGKMQHVKSKPRSGRVTSGKDVTVIADIDDDAPGSSEDLSWRTTRNRREKASIFSSHEIVGLSKGEGTENYLSDQDHETSAVDRGVSNLGHNRPEITYSHHGIHPNTGRPSSESESESRRRCRQQKIMKGKKRESSRHFTSGESSSSVFEDLDMPYLYTAGRNYNPKSTRVFNSQRRGISLGPVIEVDELHSPELRFHSAQEQSSGVGDSSAKASQVESDEILARQLQEQLYDESAGFVGTNEIDATLAMSLQEEDARLAASIARHGRYHSDASGRLINHARFPTSRRVARRRRSFNNEEMDIETAIHAHMRRNFNSAEMDLDMRLHLMEATEAAFDNDSDMPFSNNVLQIQRDFNENDYEMLLALDDNNHHVGASQSQINRLPQSIFQSGAVEEACAVCLETPTTGDVIRHLPCLHKFHKDCIDTWLRRRTLCPICKSDITP